ncbi:hypothetical protein KJZ67_04355 [Patescibacteria group bacterium]|nr:hypothetical protein [Patescibacteria group bacterium]
MKRPASLPALDLSKERLKEIEEEIISPWIEARDEIRKKLRSDFKSHNAQVKKSGYSFVLSTENEISRKVFNSKEIDALVNDEKGTIFTKQLQYPLKPPSISYKDKDFEVGELATVDDLYKCNIKSCFKYLKIEVYGISGKYITVNFSSDSSALRFSSGNTIEVNFPADESVGVIDRIKSKIKKFEAVRTVFHSGTLRFVIQLIAPIIAVYAFHKVFKIIAPNFIEQDSFYIFISMIMYLFVFIVSALYCDTLYNSLFPSTILTDCISDKRRWIKGEGLAFFLGILGIDYIIEFVKFIFSFLKK